MTDRSVLKGWLILNQESQKKEETKERILKIWSQKWPVFLMLILIISLTLFSYINFKRTTELMNLLNQPEQVTENQPEEAQFANNWNNTINNNDDNAEQMEQGTNNQNENPEVEVKSITADNSYTTKSYRGIIQPDKTHYIVPKVPGRIDQINVNVGDRVTAGDTLFTLETDEIDQKKNQASAAIRAAESQLEKAKTGARKEEIRQLELGIKQAESQLEFARNTYDRVKSLYDDNIVSRQEYEEIKTKKESGEAELERLKEKLNMAEAGARAEDIQAAKAQLDQARSQYNLANISYEDATVKAHNTGIISHIMPEEGMLVSGDNPAMVQLDIDNVTVEIEVGEKDFQDIRIGQQVDVEIDAFPGENFQGEVAEISPSASQESRLFEVKVEIENSDHKIRPGMYARAEINLSDNHNQIQVDSKSILEDGDRYIAYVINNNSIYPQEVEVREDNDQYIIKSGLERGHQIVVEPDDQITNLRPGASVNPVWTDHK